MLGPGRIADCGAGEATSLASIRDGGRAKARASFGNFNLTTQSQVKEWESSAREWFDRQEQVRGETKIRKQDNPMAGSFLGETFIYIACSNSP